MLNRLFNIFFPLSCRGCHRPGQALCTTCIRRIPLAAPLPRGNFAVFDYSNRLVRSAVRELKYHRRNEYARALADAALPLIVEYLAEQLQSIHNHAIIFVPIPEHRRKHATRGFNQSTLLATWWSHAIPKSSVSRLLTKTVFTLPQAKLMRHARLTNVAHTMSATTTIDPHAVYVIIDDVTTTGATCAEARRALTASGAKKILSIALAHGYAQKNR